MTVGVRPDDLRQRNRALLIRCVRGLDAPSRTDIAAATGLSPSTISAIAAGLIEEGVLSELRGVDPGTAARRGRPQVGLMLDAAAVGVVTVVLRLNAIATALVDYRGAVVREEVRRVETATLGGDDLIGAILSEIEDIGAPSATARIVVAVQGTADAKGRALLWSPVTGAADLPIADRIEDRFAIPTLVENDCNMMAEALRWRDPARSGDNFMALLLSDGIGMGLVHKGRLLTGTHSSGGEFGHMMLRPGGALCRCGQQGCIEAYAGNYAIWRNAHGIDEREQPGADRSAAEMLPVIERARAADGPERRALEIAGEAIGYGLGSLFALIDTAPVSIVGAGATAFDMIEPSLRAALARTAGGRHGDFVRFSAIPDELPLMREGSAMVALAAIDAQIAARGLTDLAAPAV